MHSTRSPGFEGLRFGGEGHRERRRAHIAECGKVVGTFSGSRSMASMMAWV